MKPGFLFALLLAGAVVCHDGRAETPLFASHDLLALSIPVNFKTLCRPRESEDCGYLGTRLDFGEPDGKMSTIPVEVIIRGGWRSLTKNCSAPLLFLRFNEDDTPGTPFEGQSVLPLTTHCGQGVSLEAAANRPARSAWEQYLLREYLAHRIYNEISDYSLRARLVRISYPNPDKPSRTIHNYAFLTEHFDSLAARNGAVRPSRGQFEAEKLDGRLAAQLAVFQYLIGNTDWSIARERNTVLFRRPDGRQEPVPFDFDMSGLVNAHYAGPAPGVPIDSVRERWFLGYCHPEVDWDALRTHFLAQQEAVLALPGQVPGLDKKSRKQADSFLGRFFETLQDPAAWKQEVVDRCLPWPPTSEDHLKPFTR
jgi:hypothetical protein